VQLEQILTSRDDDSKVSAELQAAADVQVGVVKRLEAEAAGLAAKARELTGDRDAAAKALPKVMQKKARLAARVAELQGRVASDATAAKANAETLAQLTARVADVKGQLEKSANPACATAEAEFLAARAEVDRLAARIDALYEKQGRGAKFKSKKERDEYLASHLAELRGDLARGEQAAAALDKDAREAAAKVKKGKASVEAANKEAAAQSTAVATLGTQLEQLAAQRTAAQQARTEAWRSAADAEKRLKELKDEADAAERALHASTPPAVRLGLESVRALAQSGEIDGIYGPLIDLFKPNNPRYNVAVDVVAGAQIFNVVVEDDEVASKVIAHLLKTKGGRVTLMPLNRLKDARVDYPSSTDDCHPLINFLKHEATYKKAVAQVFSRVLLCRTTAIAAQYARSHGLTCITLEGDMVNRKGALQGGYCEADASRLVSVARMYAATGEIDAVNAKLEEYKEAALKADQAVTTLRGQEHKAETDRARARDSADRLAADVSRFERDITAATKLQEDKLRALAEATQAAGALRSRIAELEAEIGSELTSKLNAAETLELSTCSKAAEAARARLAKATAALDAARSEKTQMETLLNENLLRRVAELRSNSSTGAGAGTVARADELEKAKRELAEVASDEASAQQELSQLEAALASTASANLKTQAELEAARAQAAATSEKITAESLRMEKVCIARCEFAYATPR
jgi:structural maintenance of chromosome 3 (chondroitin sulfate proteoglycan 6)